MQGLHTAIIAIALTGCAVISDADEDARKDADDDGVHWVDDCDDEDEEVGAPRTWYQDLDHDNFGSSVSLVTCDIPITGVLVDGDCNDRDSTTHPDAVERCNDIDDDCDGDVDEDCEDTGNRE